MQNYDEFAQLKAFAQIDATDEAAVEAFKAEHFLTDEDLAALREN